GSSETADTGEQVTFMLDTNTLPKHSIFFATKGKGFYDDAGLNVKITPGSGSYDTAVAVGAEKVEFGFSDFGAMAQARGEGSDVKELSLIHAQSPFAVVTKADSGIRDWEDLKGKTVAGEGAGSTNILFPIAL